MPTGMGFFRNKSKEKVKQTYSINVQAVASVINTWMMPIKNPKTPPIISTNLNSLDMI
jgi:hypothetical protein